MSYYDEIAKGYDALHREEQLRKLRIIEAELSITKEDTILDVGCGSGISAVLAGKITGIDPARKLLEQAPFRTVVGRAEDLPFEDDSFDVVISVTAIHNFDDSKKGLEEIARVGTDRFGLSVLKRAVRFKQIEQAIRTIFQVRNVVDEGTDVTFICKGI